MHLPVLYTFFTSSLTILYNCVISLPVGVTVIIILLRGILQFTITILKTFKCIHELNRFSRHVASDEGLTRSINPARS
jgi:hypothetical protein